MVTMEWTVKKSYKGNLVLLEAFTATPVLETFNYTPALAKYLSKGSEWKEKLKPGGEENRYK